MRKQNLAAVTLTILWFSPGAGGQTPPPQPEQPSGGSPERVLPQRPNAPPAPATQRTQRESDELQADILMARKQYSDAAQVYQKLLSQEPNNAILLNKLGIAYHQQTMLGQAKRYYERAAKADRTYANAYNNVGTVFYQQRKYGKAIQAYEKALAIRTDIPAVYTNLGYAYFGQKRYDQAMAAFRHALDMDPEVFERSHTTGSLLQDRSVGDKGLFYFYLAKSFAEMGNLERCVNYLRKARDEGFQGLAAVKTDPSFAKLVNDPTVQEILQAPGPATAAPKPPGA